MPGLWGRLLRTLRILSFMLASSLVGLADLLAVASGWLCLSCLLAGGSTESGQAPEPLRAAAAFHYIMAGVGWCLAGKGGLWPVRLWVLGGAGT